MKNGVDFIYEYSDLNLLHTRIKVLTGQYEGLIFELGGSCLAQVGDKNTFTFDYIIYETPERLAGSKLKGNPKFEEYLAYLIVDVINCRNNDPDEKRKIDEAATADGKTYSNIKISDHWYPKAVVFEQPKTTLEAF